MANEGGGKFRKQRQHYRKPYESQKTLFYRVTDAVRGIWSQSWVSRLLPSSNPAVELPPPLTTTTTTSTQLDESLPGPSCSSSSHLEQRQLRSSLNSNFPTAEREDVTFAQPFGSAPPRQQTETSTQVVRQVALDGLDQCLSTNGRSEVGSSSRRRKKWTETVAAATTAGDNQSEASEESVSTSGCSSLVPHVDKREYQKEVLQLSQSALNKLSEELQRNASTLRVNANARRAVAATVKNQRANPEDDSESGSARTSLWSEPTDAAAGTSKPQPVAHGNRPKFQASLLGSALWAEKSVLNDSAANSHNSTFYKGTTTFGGASAYSKLKLHQNTPYSSSLAARRQIRVKSAKSATSDVDIMSATAKRILHSLEKMSTPVLDAKKIPNDHHSARLNTSQILLPGYGKRPSKGPSSRIMTSTPTVGPPVGKLMTPAPVSVSATKVQFAPTKPVAKVAETEKVETKRTETAASTTTYTEKTNKGTPATGGGKMRSARSELHYSSHAAKGEEDVDVPDLPNIPLPIKNLPTFNLLLPVQKQSTEKLPEAEKDKTAKGFTFASPIALPAKTVAAVNSESKTSRVEKTTAKSNVTAVTDKEIEAPASSLIVSVTSQQTKAQSAVSAGQQVGGAQSEYKFSLPLSVVSPPKPSPAPVSVTFKMPEPKVPAKKRTSYGGESDSSLEMSPKSSPGSEKVFGGLQPAAELKTGSVMDILGKKTKKTSADGEKKTVEKEKVQTGFGAQFRPQPGSWECQVCLVRNGPSSSKCQSCDEPKAKLRTESKAVNFGDKFKPLAGSWECSSCMLRNKPDVNRCAACEASKPLSKTAASTPATQESTVVPSPTVATITPAPPLTTYKLSESMWECETCLVRNNVDSGQCIACESPKPGATSTTNSSNNSTGGFKMNVKQPPMTATAPTLFKFGFQATESATAATDTPSKTQPAQTATNTSALTFGSSASAIDGLFKFGATPTTAQSNAFTKPAAVMEGFKFGVPKETNKEDAKTVAGLKVEAVPENAGRDVASIPKSNSDVKFSVTFGAPANQEQGTTFGAPSTKPAVTSSAPPLTTTSLFGSPMVFKDVQSAPAQSSVVTKPQPGQFTFAAGQSAPEVQKQVTTTTAASIFTVADTKTTTAAAPSGGFRFAVGQKDESGRGSSEASAAKRPALAPQPSLPSFSAFTTTAAASTSSTTIGGFSFGVPPPVSSTAPTAIFGSMAPSATKNHSAAFTFGSSLATTPAHNPAPAFSTPTFGALASTPVQPTQSTAPTPVFGQIPSSAPSFTFGSTSTPPGQNLFGSGPVTGNVSANLPAFGSGSNVSALSFNSPSAGNLVPSFAAPSANLLPSYKTAVSNLPATSGAGFSFGAASAAPAPTFQFGAPPPQQQMQQPQQQPSGGFSFGTMQTPQAQQSNMFAFGSSSSSVSATPTTGFNFNPATPKAFNFSGTTEPPTFAANPNAAADANPRMRQIKRARRRTFK